MSNAGIGETLTLNNCYVCGSVPDSMDGIFDMVHLGAVTQKAGGGTGYDFSSLRPNGSPTHNDAVASGPVSFMEVFNAGTGTVLQGSRRGANMGCMSCYHPDIEEFIDCKADLNNPNKMQFFNLSVMVDDNFMEAVQEDREIDLHYPVYTEDFNIECDESKWTHRKTIRARDLWDKIIRRAYENGEPGVLFYDNMNIDNNVSYCENIIATNPCAEYVSGSLFPTDVVGDMGDEVKSYKGACNLGSLILPSFLQIKNSLGKNYAVMDWDLLAKTIETAVRMLDKVIDKNHYPSVDYENYQKNLRTIGLGITGLADTMALLGIRYGSYQSTCFADRLMNFITYIAYRTSWQLAKELGPFPFCNPNALAQSNFIQKHRSQYDLTRFNNEHNVPLPNWNWLYENIKKDGLRNARMISVAPTGTISLVYGNNCSSGLEPIFMLEQRRKVKIGGQSDDDIQDIVLYNPAWELYKQAGPWLNVTNDCFPTALNLSVDEHLTVLSAVAFHVDMSCSKTINIPEDYSFEDTKKVYKRAWVKGLKGCTIFRPNPLRAGIFVTDKQEDNQKGSNVTDNASSQAPVSNSEALPRGYVVQVDNDVIGRERHLRTGCGTLHAQAYFDPNNGDLLETYASRGSMGGCNSFMIGMSRLISLAARAGVSVDDIVDQLRSVPPCISYNNRSRDYKDTSKGTSCPSAMGNALIGMYEQIKRDLGLEEDTLLAHQAVEDEVLKEKIIEAIEDIDAELLAQSKCPDCGEPLTFEGGCNICKSCGWSKCG